MHKVAMSEDTTGKISVRTVECKWEIDYKSASCKKVGEVLKSPVFTTVNINESHRWELRLYPHGMTKKHEDFFSVYLKLLSNGELIVQKTIKIFNNENELVCKNTDEQVFDDAGKSWGFAECGKRDFIENNTDGDNKLTLVCELTVCENEEQRNILKMAVDRREHYEKLIADFEQLIDDKDFSDVQFTFGDKELHSHKNVLSKRSPVFAAMFRNEMREMHENKVEITDVRHEVFLEMLRYIYIGEVKGIKKIADELLAAADKYSVDGLNRMCEKSLIDNVNADNVLENLLLADRHSTEGLKVKCIEFIVTEAADIANKPEFRQLPCNIVCDVCSAALADKNK